MKNKYRIVFLSSLALGFMMIGCEEDLDSNEPIPYEPIGGYENSDEIAPDNLVVKMSFEGNVDDSKNGLTGGTTTNVTFEPGIKGNAYKGSPTGFASYSTVSNSVSGLGSITSAMWIKTTQHTGGAQCLFMLPKTTDFWGNIFVLIEGTTEDKMLIKIHLQKDVTPSIPWSGQWIEHTGDNRLNGMYGDWKHLAWSYNPETSKYNIYVDGTKLEIPEGLSNRYTSDPNVDGVPLGALSNSNVQGFVLGGFQQHLGAPWGAPDGWMLPYTGMIDEFRMYNSALSDTDIRSLYLLEKDGR